MDFGTYQWLFRIESKLDYLIEELEKAQTKPKKEEK